MLNHLDLFSGIGGFSLGLERTGGFKTVAFCEIEPFCQKVLKKHWPDVPIYEDVRSLEHDGPVDLISGGYPCQPFSSAGKRKGTEDDRHLWPAMFDLVKKHRPRWIIGENVAGHISMGLDDVLADLESEDYGCRVFVIPACAVGAPHRRDRVWIVAWDTKSSGKAEERRVCEGKDTDTDGIYKNVGNPKCKPVRPSARGECLEKRLLEKTGRDESSDIIKSPSQDVANSDSYGLQSGIQGYSRREEKTGTQQGRPIKRCCDMVCNPTNKRFPDWAGGEVGQPSPITEFERPDGREIERNFRGISHGVSRRVDRLKSLGNAVVPQIPEIIGHAILEAEKQENKG